MDLFKESSTLIVGLNAYQYQHNNSGIGQYIKSLYYYLIPLLAKSNNIEKIYVYITHDAPELTIREESIKLELVRLPVNRNPSYKRALFEQLIMPVKLLNDKIDVYFSPDAKIPGYFLRNMKVVTVIHDMCVFRWPQEFKASRVIFWKWGYRRTIDRAEKVIATSDFTKSEINHFLPGYETKVNVVHNGVDLRFRTELSSEKLIDVINKYNLPDKYIVFVGQLSPRKNLKTLLIAFSKIKDIYTDLNLLIVGMRGWKDDQDIQLVKKLRLHNRVIFPGFILDEDLPAVYKLAQLSVYPSLYEGFGLPPVESMACGTMCVAANTSSIPEVTGGYAELVNPTVEGLLLGITKTLNLPDDDKHRAQNDGVDYVKRFSWEHTAQNIYELINDLR